MCIKIETETNAQGCELVVSHKLNKGGTTWYETH